MKTTVELPDKLLRAAKAKATAQGETLHQFISTAVADRVSHDSISTPAHSIAAKDKPWMKHFGALKDYADELESVKKVIEEEFEQINPDDWK